MGFISDVQKKPPLASDPLEKFCVFFGRYLTRLDMSGAPARETAITLIARSPASLAARVLVRYSADLQRRGVHAKAIFASFATRELIGEFLLAMRSLSSGEEPAARLRWAKNPRLHDAHEQLTLGSSVCWSGDAMRRSEDRRNTLSLFEENSIGSVRLSALAFSAMWAASKPLPAKLLVQTGEAKPLDPPAMSDARGAPPDDAAQQPPHLAPTRH